MSGMYVKYGNFSFESGEATIARTRSHGNFSKRGFQETTQFIYEIEGEVCAPPEEANKQEFVHNRLVEITNAFSTGGKDVGLMYADNSPTIQYLKTDHVNNLTGNQILGVDLPFAGQGEYVDGRKFHITIGAEFATLDTPLLDYHDTITQIGNGGADIRWQLDPIFRRWSGVRVSPTTLVRYIHEGYAETVGAWFSPPPPLFASPLNLPSKEQWVTRNHPTMKPRYKWATKIVWHYEYILPSAVLLIPPLRPSPANFYPV